MPTNHLLIALDLSKKSWSIAFGTSDGQSKPITRSCGSHDLPKLRTLIEQARKRFGLDADAAVESCYEAGPDAFWVHRLLTSLGIVNHVIDPASIEMNRRARQAKTDRIDARKLLRLLTRMVNGETDHWREVRVPSIEDEDERRPQRELETLKKIRTSETNRIRGLLLTQGIDTAIGVSFDAERLATLRTPAGDAVSPNLQAQIIAIIDRMDLTHRRIKEIEREQRRLMRTGDSPTAVIARQLDGVHGIGMVTAMTLSTEVFGWREIRNRRELGALAGLAPTPFASGQMNRECGISKAGRSSLRRVMVQLAWGWLKFQPQSELARWYHERFGAKGKSKTGIVALARKLLIRLWRYVTTGELPLGTVLSAR